MPASERRLRVVLELLPRLAPASARAGTVAVGVVLLMLASGLRRRKRRAWTLAVVLSAAAAALHLLKGLDVEEAAVCAMVTGLLLATRPAFSGIPDPRSARHWAVTGAAALCAAVLAGVALLTLDPDSVVGRPPLHAVLGHVLLGLVGLQGTVRFQSTERAGEVAVTLALLGAVVVLGNLAALLHPAGGPSGMTALDEGRLRGLLARDCAADSLSYFALRRDKSVVFAASGKAAVAFRVIGGVTLASGDPLGDREAWPGAIDAWLAQARRYAWTPAVLAASEAGALAYRRAGLDALELGDEAVLCTSTFSMDGREMRTVRQAVSRARRLGYRCTVSPLGELSSDEVTEVRAAATMWRHGRNERGFAMALGRLGDPSDLGCVMVRAWDHRGTLCALLHLVPWGSDGLSLDLMRRAPDLDNGVTELMVVELLAAGAQHGVRQVSLNFAVFRSVFERGARIGAGPVLRAWRRLLIAASRIWQLESLYRANAKYRPDWQPRFLCFRTAGDLARVSMAALEAEAFLSRPRLSRLRGSGRQKRARAL
jgi:lysyl-tRNA synthetase class 2